MSSTLLSPWITPYSASSAIYISSLCCDIRRCSASTGGMCLAHTIHQMCRNTCPRPVPFQMDKRPDYAEVTHGEFVLPPAVPLESFAWVSAQQHDQGVHKLALNKNKTSVSASVEGVCYETDFELPCGVSWASLMVCSVCLSFIFTPTLFHPLYYAFSPSLHLTWCIDCG